jgi:hypothetical protein
VFERKSDIGYNGGVKAGFLIAISFLVLTCAVQDGDFFDEMPQPEKYSPGPGNALIQMDTVLIEKARAEIFEWLISLSSQDVSITGGNILFENGVGLFVANAKVSVILRAISAKARIVQKTSSFIVTRWGHEAVLSISRTVPSVETYIYGPLPVSVYREFKQAVFELKVLPVILKNDMVKLEITPQISHAHGQRMVLTQLSTEVILKKGRPVVLYCVKKGVKTLGASFLGKTVIVITVK